MHAVAGLDPVRQGRTFVATEARNANMFRLVLLAGMPARHKARKEKKVLNIPDPACPLNQQRCARFYLSLWRKLGEYSEREEREVDGGSTFS